MKKIPTLFVRDFEGSNGRYVLPEVTPGCEWVILGEGTPTRKYDGTCVLIRRDGLAVKAFARREVKAGKDAPAGFVLIETDDTTGKSVGWEPAEQSGYAKYIAEAVADDHLVLPGTYELVGPKVQGNPENYHSHQLVPHDAAEVVHAAETAPGNGWYDGDNAFEELRRILTDDAFRYEGIVWHHPDGRMAKLKKRDFPKAAA